MKQSWKKGKELTRSLSRKKRTNWWKNSVSIRFKEEPGKRSRAQEEGWAI